MQNTCVQMSHYAPNCSCHQSSHYDLNCNILLHYANNILEKQGDSDDDGKSLALGKIQSHNERNEKTLQGTNDPWQKQRAFPVTNLFSCRYQQINQQNFQRQSTMHLQCSLPTKYYSSTVSAAPPMKAINYGINFRLL